MLLSHSAPVPVQTEFSQSSGIELGTLDASTVLGRNLIFFFPDTQTKFTLLNSDLSAANSQFYNPVKSIILSLPLRCPSLAFGCWPHARESHELRGNGTQCPIQEVRRALLP